MIVCENCKQKMATEQTENERSFPAYAVAGGLIGAAGALATGILLLVPAGLVAGTITGLLGRRCGVCGNEIDDNEHAYHLLEEMDDGVGGRFYKHRGNAQEPASPVLPKPGPAFRPEGLQSGGQIQRPFRAADEPALGAFRETPSRDSLVFDEVEGRFVQAESPPGEERINPDTPVDLDVDTRQARRLEWHDEGQR